MPAKHPNRGFTLVELVMGMLVLAIVMTIMLNLLVPQARRSADPIFQVRATELAQSLFNEISARDFDENSSQAGGAVRCNEDLSDPDNGTFTDPGEQPCSPAHLLGPDGAETRESYDDVDDYHAAGFIAGEAFVDSLGDPLTLDGSSLYAGFKAQVEVSYAGDQLYKAVQEDVKRITVTITTPTDQQLVFTSYRSNF